LVDSAVDASQHNLHQHRVQQTLAALVGEPAATRLLQRFGSLSGIATASTQALRRVDGVSATTARQLKAAFQLSAELSADLLPEPFIIQNSADLAHIVCDRLRLVDTEQLRVVLVNARKHYLADVLVAQGSLNRVDAQPAEVFKPALEFNAAAIYLAHNHPSGDPTPSEGDIHFSQNMKRAGRLMRIPLIDHVIIGRPSPGHPEGYASLWDEGHLKL